MSDVINILYVRRVTEQKTKRLAQLLCMAPNEAILLKKAQVDYFFCFSWLCVISLWLNSLCSQNMSWLMWKLVYHVICFNISNVHRNTFISTEEKKLLSLFLRRDVEQIFTKRIGRGWRRRWGGAERRRSIRSVHTWAISIPDPDGSKHKKASPNPHGGGVRQKMTKICSLTGSHLYFSFVPLS